MNSVKHAVYYKYFDFATCCPNYFICVSDNFFFINKRFSDIE